MVGRKSLWNLHCRLFLYLQAILGFWNRVLSDLIMPSFIGHNFTVDDVENTQSMLLWCKGLIAYSDFPFKGERHAGFRNMLICVLPFSPPETMNGSFQLELALRSTMAIERAREEEILEGLFGSWYISLNYTVPICALNCCCRFLGTAANCLEAPPRCRDDGTTRGFSVQQTALGSFDAPLVSSTVL